MMKPDSAPELTARIDADNLRAKALREKLVKPDRAPQDLIAKLEVAPEGSRELDVEIYLATNALPDGAEIYRERPGTIGWSVPRDQTKRRSAFDVLHYTTNIEDAKSLLHEGWGWLLEVWQRDEAWAQVVQRSKDSKEPSGIFEGAEAKTPALAFCAALLKSHQRLQP